MAVKFSFRIYLVALLLVVFTPQSNEANTFFGLFELSWQTEKLLNFFLLIPLSFFISKLHPRLKNSQNFLICLLTSILIEIIQFIIPGRFTDFTDVIMNTFGAVSLIFVMRKKVSIDDEYAHKIRKLRYANNLNEKN